MADAEVPKKRSFRKYSYRGVDLEQLLDMSTDELVELFGARQRRRCVFRAHQIRITPHHSSHTHTHSPILSLL